MPAARIRVSRLSFSWPDGTPVFTDLSFNLGPSRVGLVAHNGAGKSTLLRLLAGRITPQSGSIEITGAVGYVPQRPTNPGHETVVDLLGVGGELRAVDAVLAGDATPDVFERADGHWDLRERIAALLARFGLHDVALRRPIATFSGGEAMVLALASRLLRQPEVLLLDEPTNHLDGPRRRALRDELQAFRGCLLVASHDRELLEGMTQIAELRPGRLWTVGGGYSAYEAASAAERAAAGSRLEHLRKELGREKRALQDARERADRRAAAASRSLPDAGLPRIVAGGMAARAEASAGKAAGLQKARIEQTQDALRRAVADAAPPDAPRFALPATHVGPTQHLLTLERVRAAHAGGELWDEHGISMTIRGPERIALTGRSGSGKTTLLRLMAGDLVPTGGERRVGAIRVTYLGQHLDRLRPSCSIEENFARAAPRLSDRERADILARLGFRGDRMRLRADALSGGERVRANLACVLYTDAPPQLLLLDEPTNNLDLDSVRQLELALRDYEGALVAVSHDMWFLNAIGTHRRLHLGERGLDERMLE